jgi:hypothetical protein
LLIPRPTPKLLDKSLLFVRCFSLSVLSATLRSWRPSSGVAQRKSKELRARESSTGVPFAGRSEVWSPALESTLPPIQWRVGFHTPSTKQKSRGQYHSPNLMSNLRMVEISLHAPIRLHGLSLNYYNPETQCPGVYWATLFLGDINTGTWPSRLGGVSDETVKYGYGF